MKEVLRLFADAASQAQQGVKDANGGSDPGDLSSKVGIVINAIFGVVGLVAVIIIILGGISYLTSQGDANKVKKGKDTILYGIIGLVIVLLAYAIVNFVLEAIKG